MKRVELIISIAMLFLILLHVVHAVGGSIGPPRLIFRENISENDITIIESYIEIANPNNIEVTISLKSSDFIELTEKEFTLQPNETIDVDFTIILLNEGNYSGDISATFSAAKGMSLTLSSEILVYAKANQTAINDNPPSSPQLVFPEDEYSFNFNTIDLLWEESSDIGGNNIIYYYDIDDNSDFSSPDYHGWTLNTEKAVDIKRGKTYYWRITAFDGKYNSSSEVWKFKAGNEVPPAPVLLSPRNGEILLEKPILSWEKAIDPDGDKVSYELLVDDNNDFASPLIDRILSETTFDTSSYNLAKKTYYWKVLSNDGIEKSQSDTRRFTITTNATTTETTATTTTPTTNTSTTIIPPQQQSSEEEVQPEQEHEHEKEFNQTHNQTQEENQTVTGMVTGSPLGIILAVGVIAIIAIAAVAFYKTRKPKTWSYSYKK